ncbi:MAG: hypothetical protein E4G89_06605 [Methanothrix sp.]|nr:MAG: hypothetical protein E4G89_06605 [Methanothrix sp.]
MPVVLAILLAGLQPAPEPRLEKLDRSKCHIFIDYRIIWTVEVAKEFGQAPVPIVNIITFGTQETPLKPEQIHLYNGSGRTAEVKKFAIDTGFEPYITNYLKVLSSSFIGFDLQGDFEGFAEPERVAIELGETEYALQAVDCLDYQMLAERIDKVNYDSPDIKEDFDLLRIPHIGNQGPVKKGRR